jgi:hypothetical protein
MFSGPILDSRWTTPAPQLEHAHGHLMDYLTGRAAGIPFIWPARDVARSHLTDDNFKLAGQIRMMTCKEVSTMVSMGELETKRLSKRMAVWMHLAMCRHCREFERQLRSMHQAMPGVSEIFEREPSAEFEAKIVKCLIR